MDTPFALNIASRIGKLLSVLLSLDHIKSSEHLLSTLPSARLVYAFSD
jgi:hypothetical protein